MMINAIFDKNVFVKNAWYKLVHWNVHYVNKSLEQFHFALF